jgi:O-antigen/teichoic acid export membrane protein
LDNYFLLKRRPETFKVKYILNDSMMLKERKLIGNIILFSVMPRVNAILSLFIFPLITPFLTEQDFGIWGLISSYYAIGYAVSTLGLDVNLVNSFFVYKSRFRYPWRILSGIIHYSGFLFSILFAFLLYFILPDVEYKLLLVTLAAFPIFFQNASRISIQLLTLREKALPVTYRTAVAGIFSVGVTWLIVAVLKLGYWGWVVAYFSNSLLIYLLFIRHQYFKENVLPVLKLPIKRAKKYLSISLPLIPYTFALVALSSSDRIIMNILGIHIDDIGIYSLGYRMANYMFTIVAGFTVALNPRLQKLYRNGNFRKFSTVIWMSYTVILSITVVGSLWMQEIFYILVRNENLHIAAPIGSIAIFASTFHIWYFMVTLPLLIEEKTKLLPWTVIIPAVLNVVLNLITIPIWGYKSALYTTYFSYLIAPFTALFIPQIRLYIYEIMPSFRKNFIIVAFVNSTIYSGC